MRITPVLKHRSIQRQDRPDQRLDSPLWTETTLMLQVIVLFWRASVMEGGWVRTKILAPTLPLGQALLLRVLFRFVLSFLSC